MVLPPRNTGSIVVMVVPQHGPFPTPLVQEMAESTPHFGGIDETHDQAVISQGEGFLMSTKGRVTGKGKLRKDEEDEAALQDNALAGDSSVSTSQHSLRTSKTNPDATELAAVATQSAPLLNPSVVQIIDTTQWPKSSPDPAGLTWIPGGTPGTGTLIMTDSEIDETPFFRPDNLENSITTQASQASARSRQGSRSIP
jgi:hypothetical protein